MTLFEYDENIRNNDSILLCGVDEAGRGPLAGDVYAAAVVFESGTVIEGINDSKKLSDKRRELLYYEIIAKAKAYFIATASVEEIDELNILNATYLAMKRAVEGLGLTPDLALIDGNRLPPELPCKAETIVKGDGSSASIAAASILAKVARDRYMKVLAEKYPQYQFEKHKGYGTKLHTELILANGPSEVHRKTFLRKLYNEK